jgi:hypothetical protein
MGSETSERMMTLLKELSVLKELDKEHDASSDQAEQEACRQRQQRQEEIAREIKEVAEQKNAQQG